MMNISAPFVLSFVLHTIVQLLIISSLTVTAVKKLGYKLKYSIISVVLMYVLFAILSPPSIYMFVFTGGVQIGFASGQPAMPSWESSIFITVQYGIVMLITTLIACRKKCANNQKWRLIFNICRYDDIVFGKDYRKEKITIWKKHPLLSNLILTMAIQIGVYLIIIFELQIIEPTLQALGVRSEGIMAPTEVVRVFVIRVILIKAAILAGIIRSKVYFWIPSFLLIFVGFAIYYPDILPRVGKTA